MDGESVRKILGLNHLGEKLENEKLELLMSFPSSRPAAS
jgi:hypothetical protein